VADDVGLVGQAVSMLRSAGFEVLVFGGWAEELQGIVEPGPHRDIDLLVLDPHLDALAEFLAHHHEVQAKHLPHKRAFLLDDVLVELLLVRRRGGRDITDVWGVEHEWPPRLVPGVIGGLPVAPVRALRSFRQAYPSLPRALWDHDFHPQETDVRIFITPPAGVLCDDDRVLVTEGRTGEHVLRHYAFADRWYKINVTTDLQGNIVEYEDDGFAFNCDLSTPMIRDGTAAYAVDLCLDVLVRDDGLKYEVTDEDELAAAVADERISRRERDGARRGCDELVALIGRGVLVDFLESICPWGPSPAPGQLPVARGPVPPVLLPRQRATW
jgi:predicted RNA-binding protein associated with RNAse of E/G family